MDQIINYIERAIQNCYAAKCTKPIYLERPRAFHLKATIREALEFSDKNISAAASPSTGDDVVVVLTSQLKIQ